MPIPEAQLKTWSHQGSITQSASTYQTIRRVLEANNTDYYSDHSYEVYLQGSYGNDTNIFSESDVDIIICITSAYYKDITELSPDTQKRFEEATEYCDYSIYKFKTEVEATLKAAFGQQVERGTKAIKINASGNRRSADVIPAFEYRKFATESQFTPGIFFPTGFAPSLDDDSIINYPREHSKNLTSKHQASNGMFKPMIRILKNMRSYLVDAGKIPSDLAPSYFIEGLLYNVPIGMLRGTYSDAFTSSINWILKADTKNFVCANECYYLLRDTNVTWSPYKCPQFLNALISLWNDWDR